MNLFNVIRLITIAGIAAAAACSKDNAENEYPQPAATQGGEATPAEPNGETASAKPTDGQILGILATIDSGEIQQAQVALPKATDPRVKQFANHMIEQHTDAKQKGSVLAARNNLTPATSAVSAKLEKDSQQLVSSLNETSTAFDTTYLKAQIQQHQGALELLRNQLAPAAQNPDLANELRTIQTMVQSHLNEATQILPTLATGSQVQPTQLTPHDTVPMQH
jgi:putative membrane protein